MKRISTKGNAEQEVLSTEQGDGLGLLCPCFLLFLILNRAALNGASTFLWGLSHLRTNPRQTGH